jgi:hypothetical protein
MCSYLSASSVLFAYFSSRRAHWKVPEVSCSYEYRVSRHHWLHMNRSCTMTRLLHTSVLVASWTIAFRGSATPY